MWIYISLVTYSAKHKGKNEDRDRLQDVQEFESLHAQEKPEYLRCLTDDCDLAGESRRTGNSIPPAIAEFF